MKKIFYVSAFTFLGIELNFIIHIMVERAYIRLLVKDFPTYGLGFSWGQWYLIHHTGTVILLIAGTLFGFWQGKYWWKKIYEKN